jgi:hypothetical protein
MTLDEVIQQHGAMAVFEAAAEGECGNLPLYEQQELFLQFKKWFDKGFASVSFVNQTHQMGVLNNIHLI